jgi:hypothetical protein
LRFYGKHRATAAVAVHNRKISECSLCESNDKQGKMENETESELNQEERGKNNNKKSYGMEEQPGIQW